MRRFGLASLAVMGALVLTAVGAAEASAHVTVSPDSVPQGTDDAILTFRVPNESATAAVVGLKIQFPETHPIVLVNPEAGSGWQVNVVKSTLPKPVTTDDGTFTSITSEIDWSGGDIPVGQFGEFNVLAQGFPPGPPSSSSRRSRPTATTASSRGSRCRPRPCRTPRTRRPRSR